MLKLVNPLEHALSLLDFSTEHVSFLMPERNSERLTVYQQKLAVAKAAEDLSFVFTVFSFSIIFEVVFFAPPHKEDTRLHKLPKRHP